MRPNSPFRRSLPREWRPRRLLILKACCIGDAVMTTPALTALRAKYPFARIDVAVGRWTRVVYDHYPLIDRVLDIGEMIGGRRPPIMHFLGLARRIADQRYDGVIVMERSFWFALLAVLGNIPIRIGFESGGRGFTHTIPVDVKGVRHEIERYSDLAVAAGARKPDQQMTFDAKTSARATALQIIEANGLTDRPFALVHPGGGSNPGMQLLSKRWPIDRFVGIVGRLIETNVRPIAVWGPGEEILGRSLQGAGAVPVGDVSLPVLSALAARASVFVGNDTGPSHIAAASGARTVVIFGPTDERRYGPFGTRADGSPVGEAVSEPVLTGNSVSDRWLDRSIDGVSTEKVWDAISRALTHSAHDASTHLRS